MPASKETGPVLRWRHEALAYDTIDRARMANEQALFYLLAIASFIETTTDLYTRNLIEYYAGDGEIQGWLSADWEPEELQHGKALRRYVEAVWPDFGWDEAYRSFFEEFRACCTVELLGPTRALEMARRCIVEMGTCSYYTMIQRLSPCSVLAELTGNIRTDEAGHYRHFHSYFQRYREAEQPSRPTIAKTLAGRVREIDSEDGRIAFKHVWLANNPGRPYNDRYYRRFSRTARALAVAYYPFRMAATMATKPLGLGPKNQKRVATTVAMTARLAARATGRVTAAH
ncbi:MAG: ferritin-like domain-containing protein [Gammaproteobacteria bacterium]